MKLIDTPRERNGASHRSRQFGVNPKRPAASAVPLTAQPPRELGEIDTSMSRKALAAGSSIGVTDRIVDMIMSRKALAAGVPVVTRNHKTPVASAIPLTGIGELSQ